MQSDDILLNKAAIVERCIRRIREESASDPELSNPTHVDALMLNIERACQACIDAAMHVVAQRRLGIPQSSADAFVLLEKAGVTDRSLARSLQGMTGFRNVAVHEYQALDPEVVKWIVLDGWKNWVEFFRVVGVFISVNSV